MIIDIYLNSIPIFSGYLFNIIIAMVAFVVIIVAIIVYIRYRLTRDEKMKYEFITIIAHKFRTPLTSIKWITDSMIADETDSFKKENLQNIGVSNQKLIDMTGTLIEIADSRTSNNSTYAIERINLCDFLKIISDNCKEQFRRKNIFFSSKCDDNNIFVKSDKPRLEFVLQTLLENAFIYTPPGRTVHITVSKSISKAKIAITDDGMGIAKEDMANIFRKFYRGANARHTDTEGLGVGLYLARSIVKRLKGNIDAYSEGEGKGSTFTVTLPRVR